MKPKYQQAIYFLSVIIACLVLALFYPQGLENKNVEFIILLYILPAFIFIAVTIGAGLVALIIILFGALLNIVCGKGINPFDN